MGPFEPFDNREDYEPLYCSAPQNSEDIILAGSDTEQTPEEVHEKRLRYEAHAQRYLRGQLPVLQSARLRGPLDKGWVNPWRERPRRAPDWWQPGSEDMLFTRANVMKWAADEGLGYLMPREALAKCKAAAKAPAKYGEVKLGDDSANAERSGNAFDVGYQSDSSEDPLSQGDDVTHSHSDPIFPHASLGRSCKATEQNMHDGKGDRSIANGLSKGTKREASFQLRKSASFSKRARWDGPEPPSPSPMHEFRVEQVRRRAHGSTNTRTLSRLQVHESSLSNPPMLHESHAVPEDLRLENRDDDFDELGDISGGTTFLSAVDYSLLGSKAAQSMLQSSTSESDDELVRATSPTKEPAFSNSADTCRREIIESGKTGSFELPTRPRSSRNQLDFDVEALEDDSFVSEVAPSSGNAEKFRYRKRRRRANKRESGTGPAAQGESENSPKAPEEPMALVLDEKSADDGDSHPESSPIERTFQDHTENRKISLTSELGPAEASSPPAHMTNAEMETSPKFSKSDAVNMLDDNDPQTEASLDGSGYFQSLTKPESAVQMPAPKEDQRPLTIPPEANADSISQKTDQDDDGAQSPMPKQVDPHRDRNGDIPYDTNSESTEDIIQSQIRAEIDLSIHSELSLDGEREAEIQMGQELPPRKTRDLNQAGNIGESKLSQLQEMAHEKVGAVGEYNTANPEDLDSSTLSGYHQAQDSEKGVVLQSPWTTDNIQLVPSVVLRGEDEHSTTNSSDRSTQPEEAHVPDSDWQPPERPKTPENDGIIPFREFMTPTPSPSRYRARPSFGGFPDTQVLVEAATSNPWAKDSEPRPKKRVSFGLPEEGDSGTTTALERAPKSPPPPVNVVHLSQDDIFADGTTAVNTFQKHFAAAGAAGPRPPHQMAHPFLNASPAISAMAEAFIAADCETSVEHGRLASGDESPSRHLQPISQAMANSSADKDGASPSRSPLGRGTGLQVDLDEFLGEAGGFLEEWSVETELRTTEAKSRTGHSDERRRLFGEMW